MGSDLLPAGEEAISGRSLHLEEGAGLLVGSEECLDLSPQLRIVCAALVQK
jgi:hypothetical protein